MREAAEETEGALPTPPHPRRMPGSAQRKAQPAPGEEGQGPAPPSSGGAAAPRTGPLLLEAALPLLRVRFLDSNFPGRDDTQKKNVKTIWG